MSAEMSYEDLALRFLYLANNSGVNYGQGNRYLAEAQVWATLHLAKAMGNIAETHQTDEFALCQHRTLNTHKIENDVADGFWTELNTYCPQCGEKL